MAKKNYEDLMVTEHIFEARHAPSGTFLDTRGYIADFIRNKDLFPHWRIETNIIHFHDMVHGIEKIGAFAGYKAAGFIAYNPETKNFFQDKAASFWKNLLKNGHYELPKLQRVGIRTKVFLTSPSSFEEINKTMYSKFFNENVKQIVGGTETDLQITLDTIEQGFKARVILGPIHKDEASNYFSFESEHFKSTGIFCDIDYSITEELSEDKVGTLLKEAMDLTWQKIERIADTLGF